MGLEICFWENIGIFVPKIANFMENVWFQTYFLVNFVLSTLFIFLYCVMIINHRLEKVEIGQFRPYLKPFTLNCFPFIGKIVIHSNAKAIPWTLHTFISNLCGRTFDVFWKFTNLDRYNFLYDVPYLCH